MASVIFKKKLFILLLFYLLIFDIFHLVFRVTQNSCTRFSWWFYIEHPLFYIIFRDLLQRTFTFVKHYLYINVRCIELFEFITIKTLLENLFTVFWVGYIRSVLNFIGILGKSVTSRKSFPLQYSFQSVVSTWRGTFTSQLT